MLPIALEIREPMPEKNPTILCGIDWTNETMLLKMVWTLVTIRLKYPGMLAATVATMVPNFRNA